jgi:hypothetical protein
MPIPLDTPILVARSGRTRPLGECNADQLAGAARLADQDCRRMVRRDAPARLYARRTREAALYGELAAELRQARLPRLRLLPLARRARAALRVEGQVTA